MNSLKLCNATCHHHTWWIHLKKRTYSAPSHYLSQGWLVIDTNTQSHHNEISVNMYRIYKRYNYSLISLKYELSFVHAWMINSPPDITFRHQWGEPSLLQVMACHLFGAKSLPEQMVTFYQLDPKEESSMKLWPKYKYLISRKYIL